MRTRLLALLFVVLAVPAALAGDVRYPQTGYPAYRFHVPDDWATQPADGGGFIALSASRNAVVTFDFGTFAGSADQYAAQVAGAIGGTPPVRGASFTVSGLPATVYQTATTNDSGVHGSIAIVVIRLDATHFANYASIEADGISDDKAAEAKAVVDSVQLDVKPGAY